MRHLLLLIALSVCLQGCGGRDQGAVVEQARASASAPAAVAVAPPQSLPTSPPPPPPSPFDANGELTLPSIAAPALKSVHTDIARIAKSLASGLGTVGAIKENGKGTPILLIEESHNSRPGQLRQGVILTMAHDQFGLKTVVLEGYVNGNIEEGADRIRNSLNKRNALAPEEFGAQMVAEGELTAVEYLALTNGDVRVLKGETTSTKNPSQEEDVISDVTARYVFAKLAASHIRKPDSAVQQVRKMSFQSALEQASTSPQLIGAWRATLSKVIAKDPWTMQREATLFPRSASKDFPSIERMLAVIEEVRHEAQQQSAELAELATLGFGPLERLLTERSAASDQMVRVALAASHSSGTSLIAMVVGAAHTEKIRTLLTDADCAFAVLRAKEDPRKGSSLNAPFSFENKYSGASVSPVLGTLLFEQVVPGRHNRPEQAIDKRWLLAKAEIYEISDRLMRASKLPAQRISGNGPPIPPIESLFADLPDDQFRGSVIWFDRHNIDRTIEDGHVVLSFPVHYTPEHEPERTFWIKMAAISSDVQAVIPGMRKDASKAELALRRQLEAGVEVWSPKKLAKMAKEAVPIVISRKTIIMVASERATLAKSRFML